MNKIYPKLIFFLLWCIILANTIDAQLILQDDFQIKNNYWYWRSDGNQSKPIVHDGLLHLKLESTVDTQYCNTEIYDPTEPYGPGTQVRVRLKCSDIHYGSRGWGFWDGSLFELLTDFDVAWIMQQGSNTTDPLYNWFMAGIDGNSLANRQSYDLNGIVNETTWHTYKIIWDVDKVQFYFDEKFLYETSEHLPDENMRMDVWIDNRVINLYNPLDQWHSVVESSELFVDYIEISGLAGPSIDRIVEDEIILWDSPNSFPVGENNYLWKQYNFNLNSDAQALLFITASAESYGSFSDKDDNLKIVVDNLDYGWDTPNSFNGTQLNGKGKSVILPLDIGVGEHNLEIFSDVTPFLRDVILLQSANGQKVYSNNFDETATQDGLWKTIEFKTESSSPITILISGTGYPNDDIRVELDDYDYGWDNENSIDGNILQGIPNTIMIRDVLTSGNHSLKLYSKGNPELYSIAAYGGSTITNVLDEKGNDLMPNIGANPNPFNNSTKITYTTSNYSLNNIRIVNSLGQEIDVLFNGFQNSGVHNLNWNAEGVSSGIYYCILESGGFIKTIKLLLLK